MADEKNEHETEKKEIQKVKKFPCPGIEFEE